MALASGTKLGPYEIQVPLGAGGMGEVYRARDTRLGRDVAIKVLPGSFADDSDRLRRFEQEAGAVAALNHPNILAVHDIGTQDVTHYIVTELLEGRTLREQLNEGALPVRKAMQYAQQIANGLAAAHDKGFVHRDLKPENVFCTKDGRMKILDFGLAKQSAPQAATATMNGTTVTSSHTQAGVVMGTAGYMSPEQVRGAATDHRSDVFAIGATLYEMLSGRRAFKRETNAETMTAILKEEPPELTGINPAISPGLERIVRRCLEKEPGQRFQSVADLGFAIEALSGTTNSVIAVTESRRTAKWHSAATLGLAHRGTSTPAPILLSIAAVRSQKHPLMKAYVSSLLQTKFVFLICIVLIAFAQPAFSQWNTANVDGIIERDEYGNTTNGTNQIGTNTAQTWYMTWDATNLYVGITNASLSEAAVIYIGTGGSGTKTGNYYDGTNFSSLPFPAQYVTYFKDGYNEYRTSSGGPWSSPTANSEVYASNSSSRNTREIAIPWSAITGGALPSSFLFFGYLTSSQGYVYGQVPNDNVGTNIGTSMQYTLYYDVTDTGNGTSAPPFSRFTVFPPFYQTKWFAIFCLFVAVGLLWAVYTARIQYLTTRIRDRAEQRANERTRIARDLHDTLLQSFQGVLLLFYAISEELQPGKTKQKIESVIDQARGALTEGRNAVQGLRTSTFEQNDLADAIITLGKGLAADPAIQNPPAFCTVVEGTSRNLRPIVRDEVYRIAGEALRNAFRHANAKRIEVQILYDERRLGVLVRDDGKGIDPKLLSDDGREGHYGLRGMRERAKLIDAQLRVWGAPDAGTEVELSIPAGRAYATSTKGLRSWFAKKGSRPQS